MEFFVCQHIIEKFILISWFSLSRSSRFLPFSKSCETSRRSFPRDSSHGTKHSLLERFVRPRAINSIVLIWLNKFSLLEKQEWHSTNGDRVFLWVKANLLVFTGEHAVSIKIMLWKRASDIRTKSPTSAERKCRSLASRYLSKIDSVDLNFRRFPVDYWGFEVFGKRICFSRIEISQTNVFRANSLSIGSQSTNAVSRWMDLRFVFAASRYLRKSVFRRARFPLVPGQPMRFSGVWAPDLGFPHQDTSGKRVSRKLDFHSFPIDQWGFVLNGPQIRIPHIGLPIVASKDINICVLFWPCSFDPVTDKQTNKQTDKLYLIS